MFGVLPCVAVCCSVLQCVAVCCSVLQCVAVCCSEALDSARVGRSRARERSVCCGVLRCVVVCYREAMFCVSRCVVLCCSVLQCVAVCYRVALDSARVGRSRARKYSVEFLKKQPTTIEERL